MRKSMTRRTLLRDGMLITTGVAAGSLMPTALRVVTSSAQAAVGGAEANGEVEKRLQELGIELPPPAKPVAVYAPAVLTGDTLYVSGHIARRSDGTLVQGKVGKELSLQQGYEAARLTGVSVLSTVKNILGSLDNVVQLAKVLGVVNCTRDFTKQPQVINGFSELMVEVFGDEAGKGARSAIGTGSLPINVPVEIEAIFEVRR